MHAKNQVNNQRADLMTHKNSIPHTLLLIVLLLASGCAATKETVTRGKAFPLIYSEQPISIVVLPPVNQSSFPEAGNYYMATIEPPLLSAGYSMFPAKKVTSIIEEKGLSNTKLLYAVPMETLRKYFDADAVLYSRIKQWEECHTGLISRLIISIEAEIVSLKTSQQLWSYNSFLNVELNAEKTTVGAIAFLAESINNDEEKAVADAMARALKANTRLLRNLPAGPTHEDYLHDQEVELIGVIPEKYTSLQ